MAIMPGLQGESERLLLPATKKVRAALTTRFAIIL
jgi:hypothetical protein